MIKVSNLLYLEKIDEISFNINIKIYGEKMYIEISKELIILLNFKYKIKIIKIIKINIKIIYNIKLNLS